MLRSLQDLHKLGVEIYFEQKNMWLSEQRIQVLLTVYCAFAQAESEDMSQGIKRGIKRGFQTGTSVYDEFVCFGHKKGDEGRLAVDDLSAKIVQKIFEMRAVGCSLGAISNWRYENKITLPAGKVRWSREAINKLLRNEKYLGDVLPQKTTKDFC